MLQKLYNRLPNLLQCFLISLFNVMAYTKRYGRKYKHYLSLFVKNKDLTYFQLKGLQEDKLESFLTYCKLNSSYFSDFMSSENNYSINTIYKELNLLLNK